MLPDKRSFNVLAYGRRQSNARSSVSLRRTFGAFPKHPHYDPLQQPVQRSIPWASHYILLRKTASPLEEDEHTEDTWRQTPSTRRGQRPIQQPLCTCLFCPDQLLRFFDESSLPSSRSYGVRVYSVFMEWTPIKFAKYTPFVIALAICPSAFSLQVSIQW